MRTVHLIAMVVFLAMVFSPAALIAEELGLTVELDGNAGDVAGDGAGFALTPSVTYALPFEGVDAGLYGEYSFAIDAPGSGTVLFSEEATIEVLQASFGTGSVFVYNENSITFGEEGFGGMLELSFDLAQEAFSQEIGVDITYLADFALDGWVSAGWAGEGLSADLTIDLSMVPSFSLVDFVPSVSWEAGALSAGLEATIPVSFSDITLSPSVSYSFGNMGLEGYADIGGIAGETMTFDLGLTLGWSF